ncbi:hypothetical protein HL658_27145 [Azospirillum sp. RWY-5-1]|uniref:Uncharacterized protein n=1 Tax=Azospirillum oleiclasticum TaxID=2735135 RepID=A0ABX2TK63_9PROT|nr:hypothetical protein [Azospirillum oleiclasticum]NYZ16234.1 hypothetical protein [Azospirillum oleiclasticum]NYZ23721.1 hypothetical protein [Azospirillum oleiclasticum]
MPNVASLDPDRVTSSADLLGAGATPGATGRPQLRLVADAPIRLAEPQVARIRGPKLVLLWVSLAAASWVLLGGMAYGFYAAATALLG